MRTRQTFIRSCLAVSGLSVLSLSAMAADTSDKIKQKTDKATVGVESVVFDALDKRSLTVNFEKGLSDLSESQKNQLTALVKSADVPTKDLKLAVAAWSDKAFPMQDDSGITTADKALAKRRGDNVVTYLKTLATYRGTEQINMADQTNALAKFFRTNDAKIKESFSGAKDKEAWVRYEAKVLRDKGGPSTAVVLLYSDADVASAH